ncbi:MAG TPA: potassium transporter TrkA [Armatimonadetes bacterium]|jgi:trk system potassium uptake protein TrkA|nr:potassium transporter TrkA [Armatimonadota bacterium]
MNILVVGGGKLTYFVCRSFIAKGHGVTLVNRDRDECTMLARRLDATVVYGDGSDPNVLEGAGVEQADVVVAVTPNDEDNLVICQLAALSFDVPQTLALVSDPDHEQVFQRLGVTAVSTTRVLSSIIEQRVAFELIHELFPVGEGQAVVTDVIVVEGSPIIGRPLAEVELPENSLIVCVLRGGRAIIPRGSTVVRDHDRVILISLPENHAEVLRCITGSTNGQ